MTDDDSGGGSSNYSGNTYPEEKIFLKSLVTRDEPLIVESMINTARLGGVDSNAYWLIKSDLGQTRLGTGLSRNQFLYLFNLATMTNCNSDGSCSNYNSNDEYFASGNAKWAKQQLVQAYDVASKIEEDSFNIVLGMVGGKGKGKVAGVGKNVVYISKNADDVVQYVGITNDVARRAAEHLRTKGISIEPLMQDLSRSDAKAVEQALIEIHGLEKNGGTLINKINSIAQTNSTYADQLQKGYDLLKSIGY